jgi:hypothetical protein
VALAHQKHAQCAYNPEAKLRCSASGGVLIDN